MSFINLNLTNVEERKVQPNGRYHLVIQDIKKTEKDGVETGRKVIIGFADDPLAQNIMHFLSFPQPDDDQEKAYNKSIMMKRFLHAFNIPFSAEGFDEEHFPGATANLEVILSEYQDKDGQSQINNKIQLPKIPDE